MYTFFYLLFFFEQFVLTFLVPTHVPHIKTTLNLNIFYWLFGFLLLIPLSYFELLQFVFIIVNSSCSGNSSCIYLYYISTTSAKK